MHVDDGDDTTRHRRHDPQVALQDRSAFRPLFRNLRENYWHYSACEPETAAEESFTGRSCNYNLGSRGRGNVRDWQRNQPDQLAAWHRAHNRSIDQFTEKKGPAVREDLKVQNRDWDRASRSRHRNGHRSAGVGRTKTVQQRCAVPYLDGTCGNIGDPAAFRRTAKYNANMHGFCDSVA
jgi:hypothetical protein